MDGVIPLPGPPPPPDTAERSGWYAVPLIHPEPPPRRGDAVTSDETLGASLRRIALEHFDRAIGGLTDPDTDRTTAVHQARKSMKRIRGLLRLVRDEIGPRIYRMENTVLRDTARLIAGPRDRAVMLATVDLLIDRYGPQLAPGSFEELRRHLADRYDEALDTIDHADDLIASVTRTLTTARARFAEWPATPEAEAARLRLRLPAIRDDFAAVAGGLTRVYRRGRRGLRRARATREEVDLHDWRKRVKYLRYQMEALTPSWPPVVGGLAEALDDLGEYLGDEHDLAVLGAYVTEHPAVMAGDVERHVLLALIAAWRRQLQDVAFEVGERAYVERPPEFLHRFEAYWEAWRTAG